MLFAPKGLISLNEFKAACRHLNTCRLPGTNSVDEEGISDLAKSIDLNGDGEIDFNEFLEAFRIVDSDRQRNSDEGTEEAIEELDLPKSAVASQRRGLFK
ncbi:unnamed protein product [Protopolystoma xenopodis]|uniref:EF-hand domain-containing protein n=1 Tax=Protopolystoma xenopodis TaxID=117903 RepID=A0A3S5CKM3_9PLAT|nr:unnamed protein product [Protopolystoma xenopodis]